VRRAMRAMRAFAIGEPQIPAVQTNTISIDQAYLRIARPKPGRPHFEAP